MEMQSARSKLWETLQVKFLGSSTPVRGEKGMEEEPVYYKELKDISFNGQD